MRKIIKVLIISTLAMAMVGCVSADIGLHKALKQTKGITEQEVDTVVTFELGYTGLNEELAVNAEDVAEALNAMEITQKIQKKMTEDKTKVQMAYSIGAKYQERPLSLSMWLDVDLGAPELKMIVEIPEIVTEILRAFGVGEEEYLAKKYFLLDLTDALKEEGKLEEIKAMVDLRNEIEPQIREYVKEMEKSIKIKEKTVKLEETRVVDGERYKVYNVKITDEAIKLYLDDIVEYIATKKETKELIDKYIVEYEVYLRRMDRADKGTEEYEEEIKAEIEGISKELYESIEELQEEHKTFKEKYTKVAFLGDEGINMTYTVNKAGYIVEEKGTVDFNVDLDELKGYDIEAIEQVDLEEIQELIEGKVSLKVKYHKRNTNINNKEMQVKYPTLTEENTLNFIREIENISK